jgi:hypothetical protein
MALVEMIGKKFGMVTVLERSENEKDGTARWKCICDCGKIFTTRGTRLRAGKAMSCGCYGASILSRKTKKHGMSETRIYHTWHSMVKRCCDEKCRHYKFYGAKGVKVCSQWKNFMSFYSWAMNNGYNDDLTIERVDCTGNYEPKNCKFISKQEQARNTRSNIRIVTDDGYMTATEVSRMLDVSKATISKFYHLGLIQTVDDAVRVINERKEKHAKTYAYWASRKRS